MVDPPEKHPEKGDRNNFEKFGNLRKNSTKTRRRQEIKWYLSAVSGSDSGKSPEYLHSHMTINSNYANVNFEQIGNLLAIFHRKVQKILFYPFKSEFLSNLLPERLIF